MQSLKDFYNKTNRQDSLLLQEYNKRYENAYKLPFSINTKNGKQYKLYYNINSILMDKIYNILNINNKINFLTKKDKGLSSFLYNELLKDEIDFTNQIENIKTSRRNIDFIQKKISAKGRRINEFKLVEYYNKLLVGNLVINNAEDLREVYDILLQDYLEVDSKLAHDNKFRYDDVYVTEGSKIIHTAPDARILEEEMNKLLEFLNFEEINLFIRVAIFHFYFGYLHPYFDGNGRTNRFMSVYKLKDKLGINAFVLSKQLMKNRNFYYKMFEETEDMFNRGDLNFFIYSFISLLEQGLESFSKEIEEKQKKFLKIYNQLKKIYLLKKDENKLKILFYLFRAYTFDVNNFVTKKEIEEKVGLSESSVRRLFNSFEADGYVLKEKIGKEFIYYLNGSNSNIKEILEYE